MSTDHLSRAKEYIAIAESTDSKREAYEKAADEIIAEFESGTSYAAIDRALGRGRDYARRLAEWRSGAASGGSLPFSRQEGDHRSRSEARKVLRDAPMEQVERIIADLPPERQAKVAEAIDNVAHPKLRDAQHAKRMHEPAEHERKARDAEIHEDIVEPTLRALDSLRSPDAHIESAIRTMRAITDDRAEIGNFDECLRLHRDLTEALWTYAQLHDLDAEGLTFIPLVAGEAR